MWGGPVWMYRPVAGRCVPRRRQRGRHQRHPSRPEGIRSEENKIKQNRRPPQSTTKVILLVVFGDLKNDVGGGRAGDGAANISENNNETIVCGCTDDDASRALEVEVDLCLSEKRAGKKPQRTGGTPTRQGHRASTTNEDAAMPSIVQ